MPTLSSGRLPLWLPLLVACILGCWTPIHATSVRDPGHAFSRRPVHVVVMERESLQDLTRGLDGALAVTLREAGLTATVRYDSERSARSYLLQQLRSQDGGGYGLLVQIEGLSQTVTVQSGFYPAPLLDPKASQQHLMGVDHLLYGAELYDLATGVKVWKVVIDMGGRAHDRDRNAALCRALLERARADGVLS